MSELKADKTYVFGEECEAYKKSEADKVIAELRDKLRHYPMMAALIDSGNKEIRHQKYKRCLAMSPEWRNYAAFCGMQSHCHNHRGFGKTAEHWSWKECHAWKCVKRWLELAEKFKEAK